MKVKENVRYEVFCNLFRRHKPYGVAAEWLIIVPEKELYSLVSILGKGSSNQQFGIGQRTDSRRLLVFRRQKWPCAKVRFSR